MRSFETIIGGERSLLPFQLLIAVFLSARGTSLAWAALRWASTPVGIRAKEQRVQIRTE
jgi:hypothetical protein